MKVIVKTWINGEFVEIQQYPIEEVQQVRHHTDGLELVLKGQIRLFNTQSILEFKTE